MHSGFELIPMTGYHMDGEIWAIRFLLRLYVFVEGPNKYDKSHPRATQKFLSIFEPCGSKTALT